MRSVTAALLLVATVAAIVPAIGTGAPQPGPIVPQPVLGVADSETKLMGTASEGQPGEVWGYRLLPLSVAPPVVNGTPLEFGAVRQPQSPDPQLVFSRYTESTGWQFAETADPGIQQTLTAGTATGGTFTLSFGGEVTAPIAFDASAATIQAALEALPNLAPGEVVAAGLVPLTGAPVTVTFPGVNGGEIEKLVVDVAAITGGSGPVVRDTYRGSTPNERSARITPHGGAILVGKDPALQQPTVLHRNPGGRFGLLPAPPADVLLPGETLATEDGNGRVAVAAFEEDGRTGTLFGVFGPMLETAVLHFDGQAWSREPVDLPGGPISEFRIRAIAATELGNAWLLAHAPGSSRGVLLFERQDAGSGPRWVERDLHAPLFSEAATGRGRHRRRAAALAAAPSR